LIGRHRIALIAAAAFNFVFFFPLLFMGRVVSPNDVFYNFDPWSLLPHPAVQNSLLNDPPTSLLTQIALLRQGGAFHWDPFVASGIPGVGWAALISPFIVIAAFCVPMAWVYTALIFLKLNVAFFFAYAWLREERIGRRAAAIGAIIIAGSGIYSVRWLWQMTNATALYPALLWLVRRTFNGKRNSIAVTVLIALSYALAGFPAAMAYGAYMTIAYAIFLAIRFRRLPARGVAEAALAVGLALMIAAPFLATFVQFIQRSGYLGVRQNLSLSVFYPRSHLMSFINPQRLGNNAYKDWKGDPALGSLNNYFESTIYLGLATIPLALLALLNRRARSRWFWLAAAVVLIGAMFGVPPIAQVLGRIPGFKYSPLARTSMLLPLPAGYLAASGAAWLVRRRWRDVIAGAIAVVCAFDLGLFAGRFHPYMEPKQTTVPTTATIEFLRSQQRPFRVAPFFLYLWPNSAELFGVEDVRSHFSSEAKYRAMLQRIDPSSWSGVSTVIQFNSLHFKFDDPFVSMLGVRYLIEQKSIDIVKWSIFANTKSVVTELKDNPFVLKQGALAERTVRVTEEPFYSIELPVSIEEAKGRDPRLVVQLLRFGAVAWERSFTPDETAVMGKVYVPLRPYARLGESVTLRLQSVGVRARFLKGAADPGESQIFYGRVETPIVFDRELPDGRIFLNVGEVPRFRVAKRLVKMTDAELLARRDLDFAETTAITDASVRTLPATGDASLHLARYGNEEQRLSTDSSTPFFLASSEKLTPELRIAIDGRTARPVEINSLFAGVEVPAGTHRIVFERRIGRGWWWATIVGTAAFLLLALMEVASLLRRRTVPQRG
jgi:hypothetical protein